MNCSKPNRSIFYEFDSFQESVPCSIKEITFAIGSYWEYFKVVFVFQDKLKSFYAKNDNVSRNTRYQDVCWRTIEIRTR